MKYKNHKEFFDIDGKRHVLQYDQEENETTHSCKFEEMYQHFKARMVEESTPKQDGMVLVNANVVDVVRDAIFNIKNAICTIDSKWSIIYEIVKIKQAIDIIEGQLNGK